MNPRIRNNPDESADIRIGKGWIRGFITDIRIITNRIDGSRIHPDRNTTSLTYPYLFLLFLLFITYLYQLIYVAEIGRASCRERV